MAGILDTLGKILECNHYLLQNTGYERNELIGITGPVDLVEERDRERAMLEFEKMKANAINMNVPIMLKRKDHSVFPTIWSGSILRDDEDNILGYLVTGKDLSKIYQSNMRLLLKREQQIKEKLAIIEKLEQSLSQTRDKYNELEAERAKRLMTIGEITSRFTHDIRNPLSTIHNATELLRTKNRENMDVEQPLFDMIDRSISRISSQVDDILNFVRSTDIKKEPCSLSEVINSSLGKIRMPENIKVVLPQEDLQVYCDKIKLELIIENLITNAIQAIDASKGTVTITVEKKFGYDMVKVSDSGPGIPRDILPRIFEPLFTTKRSGTGLGLPTCKNLAEQHGWMIEVRLPSTFIIRMPHRE